MQLHDLTEVLEEIAPTRNAESWDNVGLLLGDPGQDVTKVLLTIDYTQEVAQEGEREGCDAVVAYHPPIFHPLKRLRFDSVIYDAARRGVAIYSPHTALDVAEGGTNDVLADAVGLGERAALKLAEVKATQYKLVVFTPGDALEKVSRALFEAGAGRIGKYSSCSFRSPGTGTFFGEEGTNPAVGQSGRLEEAQEVRLETVVPVARIEEAIRALRNSHPYEEPAFDLNLLAAAPEGVGQGRIGTLAQPADRVELVERVKRALGLGHVLVAGPLEGEVTRAAVCAGSCGELLDEAIKQQAQLYVTGEMRHHEALKAAQAGLTVVCTLHSNSERAALRRFKERLEAKLPGLPFVLSRSDKDPLSVR